ncbi:MAG: GNAT family N-acetyltransferase [Bdellovibrionota bacterium]
MGLMLVKMTEDDLSRYLENAISKYAHEKMKGEGLTEGEAYKISKDSYSSLLPDGIHSKNQYLFNVVEEKTEIKIGILWIAEKANGDRKYAYIYDIEINEDHRGKGYGKKVMHLLEDKVKSMNLNSIGLHVFGHNTTAISLYEKMGYRTTNRVMRKDL